VTGTASGSYVNVTGTATSDQGAGSTQGISILNVAGPPGLGSIFSSSSIGVGQTSSLIFTLTNANPAITLTGIGFTDTPPAGVQFQPGTSNACGGTLIATANSLSLSGATVAANAQCQFTATVTASSAGIKTNSTSAVTSTEGGSGTVSTAQLTVNTPFAPAISASFNPTSVPVGQTSSLTFTIAHFNPGTSLTGVGFTDTLPAGLTVANATTTTCGGTLTTNGGSVALSGATLAPNGQCQFSVTVTATTPGNKTNTTSAATSNESGAGNPSAPATLSVTVSPPVVSSSFLPSSINVGQPSFLAFTITNPNAGTSLTGVGFTDTLPAGLIVPNQTTAACGGTLTLSAPQTVSLSGATIAPSGQCQFTVTVTGLTTGTKTNTAGPVVSTEGGLGNSTTATLDVTTPSPPVIASSFNPTNILVGATSSLTFTITNTNAGTALTGIGFTDTLPAGTTVASANSAVCGGTLLFSTPPTISLSGASIPPHDQCQFSVTVTGATAGSKVNTTSAVTSNQGGSGNSATATLTVTTSSPPSITSSFSPSSINVGQTSALTFTIANPNAGASLTGIGFTDALPAGLTTANATSTTCGGALTTSGPSISFSGATIAANGQCQFSVIVTATTAGTKTNTTGTVTSNEGGSGNTTTASLTVGAVAATTASLVSSLNPSQAGQAVTFTATVTSSGGTPTGSVSFLDNATVLGTVTVSGGIAAFSISTLTTGTHPITASYQPGPGFLASTSAVLVQTVQTPTDSLRLRALQVLATPVEAQVSGQAFSGAVQSAISEGFGGGGPLVSPNGSGIRFNFAADADVQAQAATAPRATDPFSSADGSLLPGRDRPSAAQSRVDDAMSALDYAAPAKAAQVATPREWFGWAEIRGATLSHWNTSFTAPNTSVLYGSQVNLLAGLTYRFMPNFLIGALGGYETFDYRSDALFGRLKGDGWTVGAYLGWKITDGIRFDAAAGYSGIGYNGTAGSAAGTFAGNRWMVSGGLTGTYSVFGFGIEPSARVYALWEHENAYTDTLGTLQAARDFSTGRASAGVKVIYPFAWTDTVTFAPYAGLYGDYYFNTDNAAPVIGLAGLPGGLVFDGFSARAIGGLGATFGGGAQVTVGFERSGLGGDFALWVYRARASVPFSAQ
jgi:uncharacterized repeat protein (TIGR01451 family)